MGFLARIFRFLFWVLILSWAVKLLARALGSAANQTSPSGAGNASADEPSVGAKRLVRDPVCGMHMAQELALPATANGETQYFCSEECRMKFASSVLQRAASA
jgi:YHS domain-containing protein